MISKIFRKFLRLILKPFIRKNLFDYSSYHKLISLENKSLNDEETSEYIFNALTEEKPFMVSRFGYTELNTLFRFNNYIKMNEFEKIYHWSETLQYPFSKNCRLNNIHKLSGFFPVTKESLFQFKKEMINSIKDIDLLGSWVDGENKFINYMQNVHICNLSSIEPYFSKNPWSFALKNKKVLVIHPFATTIENQFKQKREKIFKNKNILPDFNLKTLKAPITYPGSNFIETSWFEILDQLTNNALQIDFDIAIIGCGAYGMPLASRIKKAGKKAIHLGGATQILFGIKGKRWDEIDLFKNFYNEHWVYPSPENKIYQNVEGGCYW
tara:strand:- start:7161 stop:8135 length:975 start_codon:yes stop_codon:yes gene_type:complete